MQGKVNTELIKKEFQTLFNEALNDIMAKIEKDGFIVTDDDNHDDGTNIIRIDLSLANNDYANVTSLYWDMYRKHQLLGDGAEIDYNKKDIMELEGSIKTDINKPVQAPTTTIPIEKEDIKKIISMLYNLTTYHRIHGHDDELSKENYLDDTRKMFEMINKLLGLL